MEVLYDSKELERLCTDEREMRRRRADIEPRLKLRINALKTASTLGDLQDLDPLGMWHPLHANRVGTWAGKLSGNYRLVICPEGDGDATEATVVTVVEITDYHR